MTDGKKTAALAILFGRFDGLSKSAKKKAPSSRIGTAPAMKIRLLKNPICTKSERNRRENASSRNANPNVAKTGITTNKSVPISQVNANNSRWGDILFIDNCLLSVLH